MMRWFVTFFVRNTFLTLFTTGTLLWNSPERPFAVLSLWESKKVTDMKKKKRKKIISGGGKTDYIHTKCVLPKMFHTILCSPPDRSTADEHSKFCTDRKSFQKRKGVRFSKGRRRAFQSLGKKQFLLYIWWPPLAIIPNSYPLSKAQTCG